MASSQATGGVMTETVRPRIVLSRCIEVDSCRWDGLRIASEVVRVLLPHVDLVSICPEVEIGLGVPRPPIRVISTADGLRLYQPATERDCTAEMVAFADAFLGGLGAVDGFILKSHSPSCGARDVGIYQGLTDETISQRGAGFFAAAVAARCVTTAIEDEARLADRSLRHHFFVRIYAAARFRRQVLASPSIRGLVAFHAAHKLLLLACDERQMRAMGKIVANHDALAPNEVISAYGERLSLALAKPPSPTASVNVLQHALGYMKVAAGEKRFFLDRLEDYRLGRVPLSVPTAILRSWIVRSGERYLAQQAFFTPYPDELLQITDPPQGGDL